VFLTVATLLAAALTASDAPPSGDVVALGALPAEQLEDVVLEALPPAPSIVVRETRYYGTVTIDHRAHLARRAACKTCHDPGPIRKLTFTPKVAHDRCIGCHTQVAKGPTNCQGCHVKPPPAPAPVVAAAAPVAQERTEACPDPKNLSAAFAAFDSPRARESGGVVGKEPFHRWLEVGLAAGSSPGVSVRVAHHQNFLVVTQSVERLMSSDEARTLALLGAGISRPIHSQVALEAVGLAGLDAVDKPDLALIPAVGARAGIQWRPGLRFFKQVTTSVTGVYDLSTRSTRDDREVGGFTIYGTVATGFKFPPK
jgi:hypothetical protein